MGQFIKGDVVVIPFPFTDLSGNKKRPAFVVTDLPGRDIIVCQITSKFKSDSLYLLFGNTPARAIYHIYADLCVCINVAVAQLK